MFLKKPSCESRLDVEKIGFLIRKVLTGIWYNRSYKRAHTFVILFIWGCIMKWLHLSDLHFNPVQDGTDTNYLREKLKDF